MASTEQWTNSSIIPLKWSGMILSLYRTIAFLVFYPKYSWCVSLLKSHRNPQENNHQNISNLLDNLLYGYDNSIRPDFGGPAAVIEVDIMVRSMGPVSEVDMTYSMDCYFRQSWVDRRLAFSVGHENDTLALSIKMLQKIWKPDTYFYNGKQSYLHTITTPNKFVRLLHDGRVLYSSRLTIKAGCPMNLEDFPMDIQRCPLKFGSFGYTTNDVVYRWNSARQIAIAEDMKLSQFDLIATPAGNQTDSLFSRYAKEEKTKLEFIGQTIRTSSGMVGLTKGQRDAEYSMLLVSFHLRRHMGNFLIQVYGPCVLLVVLSWVSFWLNREATADRVSLGITTVLTMTFLGLEARTDLPKVAYPTALDFFVFLAFVFIFATIIQFAVVHYFTKYGSGECYFSSDFNSDESSSSDEEWETIREKKVPPKKPLPKRKTNPEAEGPYLEIIPLSGYSVPPYRDLRKSTTQCSWTEWWQSLRRRKEVKTQQPIVINNQHCNDHRLSISSTRCIKKKKKRTPRFNSVSKIDRASRIVFPVLFIAINIFYWYFYLSRTNRLKNASIL